MFRVLDEQRPIAGALEEEPGIAARQESRRRRIAGRLSKERLVSGGENAERVRDTLESINLGRPLCGVAPTSRAGRDIDAIARQIVPVPETEATSQAAPRKRLRLFGKE